MKKQISMTVSLISAVLIICAVVAAVFILQYNAVIKKLNGVEEAKGQIEAVLQRRLNLIPNLIETVKAYAAHEKTTFEAVTQARTAAKENLDNVAQGKTLSKEEMNKINAAHAQLTGAVNNILALVERYPDLKAAANFMALQDQMEGTENRISVERQRYNSAVKAYNTRITVFPGNILAGLMQFRKCDYFEADDPAKTAPKAVF